jgi:hypothetical protein
MALLRYWSGQYYPARNQLGPEAWTERMHPEIPETTVLDNPYTYTQWDAGSAQWKGGLRGDDTA